MFLTIIVVSAISLALFKLGALSVWVAVLSMAFKAMLFVGAIGIVFWLVRYLRQRRKGSES